MNDTIVTISTALGQGAISIIRVSGIDSIAIVNKIFSKDLTNVLSHTINYGYIINDNEVIDEVLVSVMRTPKTYTREDIVEINCHGGIATTNEVLELLIQKGCRLATRGEFTKRAFLNGRIDLIQAEGIDDLLKSSSEVARKKAIASIRGTNSNLIKDLREKLVEIISNIEVNIDYPEYEDIEVLTNEKILPDLKDYLKCIEKIIDKSKEGNVINEGIKVALIGKPNVGKSSLLNTLIGEEKAIVTNIAGTTRDIVEGNIEISGIQLHLIDTAGIRKTDNVIEQMGVEKSKQVIDNANLLLLVLNNNEVVDNKDLEIIDYAKKLSKPVIILINKIDLEPKIDENRLPSEYPIVKISTKTYEGIDILKNKIKEMFNLEKISNENMEYLFNSRSIGLLKNSYDKINEAISEINKGYPIDIVELDIKSAWEVLGEIIGETYTDELIDNIFDRFCLGK